MSQHQSLLVFGVAATPSCYLLAAVPCSIAKAVLAISRFDLSDLCFLLFAAYFRGSLVGTSGLAAALSASQSRLATLEAKLGQAEALGDEQERAALQKRVELISRAGITPGGQFNGFGGVWVAEQGGGWGYECWGVFRLLLLL
jgi:hypothetical protein